MNACQQVARWLQDARSAVAFTGAGASTESGIPDFRSPGGIWANSTPVYFDDFLASAAARHEYWRQKAASHSLLTTSQPNTGHQTLAKWESQHQLRGVITQNIDGLHQVAGCANVLELHGTARFIACLDCSVRFEADALVKRFLDNDAPPTCSACGGILKHATVSFGQLLPADVLETAMHWACEADLFLAMGSSLVVEPAASLPRMAQEYGARLVIINRDPTPLDRLANVVINDPIGETLLAIDGYLRSES